MSPSPQTNNFKKHVSLAIIICLGVIFLPAFFRALFTSGNTQKSEPISTSTAPDESKDELAALPDEPSSQDKTVLNSTEEAFEQLTESSPEQDSPLISEGDAIKSVASALTESMDKNSDPSEAESNQNAPLAQADDPEMRSSAEMPIQSDLFQDKLDESIIERIIQSAAVSNGVVPVKNEKIALMDEGTQSSTLKADPATEDNPVNISDSPIVSEAPASPDESVLSTVAESASVSEKPLPVSDESLDQISPVILEEGPQQLAKAESPIPDPSKVNAAKVTLEEKISEPTQDKNSKQKPEKSLDVLKDITQPTGRKRKSVQTCQMKDWGIQFTCDFEWPVRAGDSGQEVVLAEEPMVTLSWEKFDKEIRFLGQLNQFFFEKFGKYKDGFRTEQVEFAGRNAVLVKGYAKDNPDVQVNDYYYPLNNQLRGVFFRLSPSDQATEGNQVIRKVRDSFSELN